MSAGDGTRPAINVTPLIDVMLVLLIIFLVLMPIVLRMENVKLPPKADRDIFDYRTPIALKLHADLTVSIDDAPAIPSGELLGAIRTKATRGKTVFIDFDEAVPWSEVVGLVDSVRGLADGADHNGIAVACRIYDSP